MEESVAGKQNYSRFVYSHSMVLQSMCTQGSKGVCLCDHVAYCLNDWPVSDSEIFVVYDVPVCDLCGQVGV